MLTTPRNQKNLFRVAVIVTLAAALLPWRGWTNDVAAVVSVPIELFGDAANVMLGWARPLPDPIDGVPAEARTIVEQLVVERDLFQQQLRAAELRIDELMMDLEEMRLVPEVPAQLVVARVTAHNSDPLGTVKVMGGSARGVGPGTVVVCRGVQLLGQVVEVSRFTSLVLPITNPGNRYIVALVHPGDVASQRPPAEIQLEPTGEGSFSAQVDRAFALEVGDDVTLNDPDWPETAQSRIIGQVSSVEPIDQDPLRHAIVVTPRYRLHQVSRVTLLVQGEQAYAGGDLP